MSVFYRRGKFNSRKPQCWCFRGCFTATIRRGCRPRWRNKKAWGVEVKEEDAGKRAAGRKSAETLSQCWRKTEADGGLLIKRYWILGTPRSIWRELRQRRRCLESNFPRLISKLSELHRNAGNIKKQTKKRSKISAGAEAARHKRVELRHSAFRHLHFWTLNGSIGAGTPMFFQQRLKEELPSLVWQNTAASGPRGLWVLYVGFR